MDGFEQYVQQQGKLLLRVAYLLTRDAHLAEDLVQSTLLQAYRKWPKVQRVQLWYSGTTLDLDDITIAERLNIAPGTVRAIASRALAQLRADSKLLSMKDPR